MPLALRVRLAGIKRHTTSSMLDWHVLMAESDCRVQKQLDSESELPVFKFVTGAVPLARAVTHSLPVRLPQPATTSASGFGDISNKNFKLKFSCASRHCQCKVFIKENESKVFNFRVA